MAPPNDPKTYTHPARFSSAAPTRERTRADAGGGADQLGLTLRLATHQRPTLHGAEAKAGGASPKQ